MMELDRYNSLMEYMKDYAVALNHHEREYAKEHPEKRSKSLHNIFQTIFPRQNCWEYASSGLIICFNPRFIQTIQLYETCFKKNPDAFQNGDAIGVLKVLYESSHYWRSFEDYQQYLKTEACCYIVLTKADAFGEILRIDLFRKYDPDKNSGKLSFTSGLFHCLKHFSMDGINLCNGSDKNDTFDLMHIVYLVGRAFSSAMKNDSLEGNLPIDDSHYYKAIFYHEECSSVYFLNSFRIAEPQKEKSLIDDYNE